MKIGAILPVLAIILLSIMTIGVVAEENVTGSGWHDQGLAAFESENYEEAVTNFLKAVEENPEDEQALFKLGGSYLMSGDVESALYAFQNVTTINPENGNAWSNIGMIYLVGKEKPDPVPALEALAQAVEYT